MFRRSPLTTYHSKGGNGVHNRDWNNAAHYQVDKRRDLSIVHGRLARANEKPYMHVSLVKENFCLTSEVSYGLSSSLSFLRLFRQVEII